MQIPLRIRLGLAFVLLLLAGWSIGLAQSGQVIPMPKFAVYDSNGDPCSGCKLYSYAAGTTTPQDTYTSSALSTPNANPVVMDSAGRATIFLSPSLSYKFTLKTSADVDIWTVDNVVGPFSGVITVSVGNTRGVQITRSGAASGLSIASTGGSGKTWGLESTTSGELKIQDDADGSPRFQLGSGDNASVVTTGTFTVSGGNLAITGTSPNTVSASTNGAIAWTVTNSSTGAAAYSAYNAVDSAGNTTRMLQLGSSFTSTGAYTQKGGLLQATGNGGLSLDASDAAGTMRFFTGGNTTARMTIDASGRFTQTSQPAFLAYNSASDLTVAGISTTLEFDTEVTDRAGNFAANTFTAPVTGDYLLCAESYIGNSSGSLFLSIVTSNRSYRIGISTSAVATVQGGCVMADMDASDTATVTATYTAGTADIYGGSVPLVTYFSGRLLG